MPVIVKQNPNSFSIGIFYVLKGRLLHCKRCPFELQKVPFYIVKHALLQAYL